MKTRYDNSLKCLGRMRPGERPGPGYRPGMVFPTGVAMLVLALCYAEPCAAEFIQAHAHTKGKARLVQRDNQQGSYWTSDGDYRLFASGFAREEELTDTDSARWPGGEGWALKSTLPGTLGSIDPEHSHQQANGVVAADAVAGAAEGYAFASAAWTPGWIWGTFEYHAYAYAIPSGGVDSNAHANGYVDDPTTVYYDDSEPFDLIMEVTLAAGTSLSAGSSGVASGVQSGWLDLNADGETDQLWWRLAIGADAVQDNYWLDFSLGPNVYLDGGLSEADIEDLLNASWTDDGSFELTEDVTFSAVYEVVPGGQGWLIFGLDADANGDSSSIPEPASLSLLALGGLVALRRRRVQHA